MKVPFLLLSLAAVLLGSCRHNSKDPYRYYKYTNAEAIPASYVGGVPYGR